MSGAVATAGRTTRRSDVRRGVEHCRAAEPRRCPVDGCGEAIADSRAMCRRCWRRVPREIQLWVRATAPAAVALERWLDAMCAAVHAAEVYEA